MNDPCSPVLRNPPRRPWNLPRRLHVPRAQARITDPFEVPTLLPLPTAPPATPKESTSPSQRSLATISTSLAPLHPPSTRQIRTPTLQTSPPTSLQNSSSSPSQTTPGEPTRLSKPPLFIGGAWINPLRRRRQDRDGSSRWEARSVLPHRGASEVEEEETCSLG